MNNKHTYNDRGINYEQTLPDDAITVEHYGRWNSENLFYSINTDIFYVWNGMKYRVIEPFLINKGKSYVTNATDVDNAQYLLYYTTFK